MTCTNCALNHAVKMSYSAVSIFRH